MKAFMPVGGNKTDQSYGKLRDRLLPLEIVKGFCDADDICYGNMHKSFSRSIPRYINRKVKPDTT